MPPTVIHTRSDQEFVAQATQVIEQAIDSALKAKGRATLALSGGSTPGPVYRALGEKDIPWDAVSACLVDERYIGIESADSNTHLIQQTLLAHAEGLHFVHPDTSQDITACVQTYAEDVKSMLQEAPLDLSILGMGEDGHIASLFPPLTKEAFSMHTAIHTETNTFAVHDRISLSLPVLKEALHTVLLLKGEKKKDVYTQMMNSNEGIGRYPLKAISEERLTVIMLD